MGIHTRLLSGRPLPMYAIAADLVARKAHDIGARPSSVQRRTFPRAWPVVPRPRRFYGSLLGSSSSVGGHNRRFPGQGGSLVEEPGTISGLAGVITSSSTFLFYNRFLVDNAVGEGS